LERIAAGTAERDTHHADDPRGGIEVKEIRCSEVGFFPDCQGVMRGEDEEEVMAAAAEHGRTVHGMTDADFTDENVEIIRSHIRDV
jgi:predicted small metal-binding protein